MIVKYSDEIFLKKGGENMKSNVGDVLNDTFNATISAIVAFLPRFISGLIVLLVGIIISAFLKQIVVEGLKFLKLENILKKYGVPEKGAADWGAILGELVRWFVLILFIVPVAEVWGLGKFAQVLNGLLLFLPNVFVAVLLLMVGFVISKLVYDLLKASIHGLSKESAGTVANVGRWAVIVFVFLVVLNQLGIASDLIRILFGGFVAMVALAGGLAFGLGGRDAAKEIIEQMRKKL